MDAQERLINDNELVGCWKLLNQKESNKTSTNSWVDCGSDMNGPRIILNNYNEFKYYSAIENNRCGNTTIIASGRFKFDKENQIIKLIDRKSQKTISWKLKKNGDIIYSSDLNYPQQRI
ncbi:hypothetical protein G5B37_03365 [Rasiella rasia]|uniref:Lipocalin-like domain-containing protein n=1 Tax=Rasiella rasia TaxID=2744027 RepID=A0A6G6GLR1_9FLAO|nr:hypothetical protein [Rasiella rasia]QIE58631.1 hypothetical protein G5B37_03365 [Rasiella rasia]